MLHFRPGRSIVLRRNLCRTGQGLHSRGEIRAPLRRKPVRLAAHERFARPADSICGRQPRRRSAGMVQRQESQPQPQPGDEPHHHRERAELASRRGDRQSPPHHQHRHRGGISLRNHRARSPRGEDGLRIRPCRRRGDHQRRLLRRRPQRASYGDHRRRGCRNQGHPAGCA